MATKENYDFCYSDKKVAHSLMDSKEGAGHHPHGHLLGDEEIIHIRNS